MGVWAWFLIYLSSSIKVEQHVATLLVTCRMSYRQYFLQGRVGMVRRIAL